LIQINKIGAKIMQKATTRKDKSLEKTINEILESRTRSRIYLYLLRKNGAKSEQIIRGTRLHPSTVRETLSEMYVQGLIYRKKIKNGSIGKNPYMYYPISPVKLLKKYVSEIEYRLNKLASLALTPGQGGDTRPVRITIYDEKADEI
jgi:predicted DNA-binding transcriptional regulator